jgi:hypothetical protein
MSTQPRAERRPSREICTNRIENLLELATMKKIRKSPFPGMDPYLEQRWGDVHSSLCVGIRSTLQPILPGGLRARAKEDVLLESQDDEDIQNYEPDITIVETGDANELAEPGGLALAVQPVAVRHIRRPKRRRWVEILDTSNSNRMITAIEILSPGNKAAGRLNQSYREKIAQNLEAGANVVEVDLLRSSRKRLAVPAYEIPEDRRADNYTCLCRATDSDLWLVYPMPLRQALPTVPIPCRETDADVPLDLQPIIDRIYLEGAHDDLDYSQPPEPPFTSADAEWAAELSAKR